MAIVDPQTNFPAGNQSLRGVAPREVVDQINQECTSRAAYFAAFWLRYGGVRIYYDPKV
jgi:hypothetical protein